MLDSQTDFIRLGWDCEAFPESGEDASASGEPVEEEELQWSDALVEPLGGDRFRLAEKLSLTPFGPSGPGFNLGDVIQTRSLGGDCYRYVRTVETVKVWSRVIGLWHLATTATEAACAESIPLSRYLNRALTTGEAGRVLRRIMNAGGSWEYCAGHLTVQLPLGEDMTEPPEEMQVLVHNLPRLLGEEPERSSSSIDLATQLQEDVERIVVAGGRLVGSSGHREARAHLVKRLSQLDLAPYAGEGFELPYRVDGVDFVNVLARLPGSNPDLPPVTLIAHYDTCGPLPGADDNAAAIAILLALVPRLREKQLERSFIFAFPDAEEPPYFLSPAMGSTYYYDHQRTEPSHCALVLDLVGHDVPIPNFESAVFITGMESDPGLEAVLMAAAPETELKTIPTLNRYIGDMSDHRPFRLDCRPYLFFSCGQWEHYHAPSDTPEKLNYEKMAALVEYLSTVAESVSRRLLDGPFEGYDTTPTELYFLRRHGGPLVAASGLSLETREDIDLVVAMLRSSFYV